ncbi:hypothetical protein BHM03_00019240 [Ensete ventricosum]|nr:hypothetical protein BHM03_00019240 [Ensete ventricosum]
MIAGNTGGRWHKCRWQQWRVAVVSPVKAQEMATVGEAVKEAGEGRGNSDSSEGYSRGGVLLMADRGAVDAATEGWRYYRGGSRVDVWRPLVVLYRGLADDSGREQRVADGVEKSQEVEEKHRNSGNNNGISSGSADGDEMRLGVGEAAIEEEKNRGGRQYKDGEKLQRCGRCNSDDSDSGVVCKGSGYGVTTRMLKIAALIPIDRTPQDAIMNKDEKGG